MSRHLAPRMPWHQVAARFAVSVAIVGIIFLAPSILGGALGNWLIAEFL